MKCCKSFSDLCFLSWLLDKKQTHDIKIHTYRLLTYSPRRTGWMDISNLAFSRVSKTWRLTLSQGFFLIKFPLFSAWLGGWGQGINHLTPWLVWINGEKQWMKRASESYQFNLCIYSPSFLLWESPCPGSCISCHTICMSLFFFTAGDWETYLLIPILTPIFTVLYVHPLKPLSQPCCLSSPSLVILYLTLGNSLDC